MNPELLKKIYTDSLEVKEYVEELAKLLQPCIEPDEIEVDIALDPNFELLLEQLGINDATSSKQDQFDVEQKDTESVEPNELEDLIKSIADLAALCSEESAKSCTKDKLRTNIKLVRNKIEQLIEFFQARAGIADNRHDIIARLQAYSQMFEQQTPSNEFVLNFTESDLVTKAAPVLFTNNKPKTPEKPKPNDLFRLVAKFGADGNESVAPPIYKPSSIGDFKSEYMLLNLLDQPSNSAIKAHIRIDKHLMPKYEDEKWHLTLVISHPSQRNRSGVVHYYYSIDQSKRFPRMTAAPAHPLNFAIEHTPFHKGGSAGYLSIAPEYKSDAAKFQKIAVKFIADCRNLALQEANNTVNNLKLGLNS